MAEKRLGRGLDFLINEEARFEGDEILEVDIESVRPNRLQPRSEFDPDALDELAQSIKMHGVLQPVVVRPSQGGYELIAGERRWRASKAAGRDTIPAVIRDVDEKQLLELAIIENIHRSDLNPIEKAEACRNLISRFGLSQVEAAERLGQSRSSLANLLRLLELPDSVRTMVASGILSFGHAKVILGVASSDDRIALARKAVERGLSVRQLEELVGGGTKPAPKREPKPKPNYLLDLEEQLHTRLGTKVTITEKDQKGKIVIDFYSQDDFERLLGKLNRD